MLYVNLFQCCGAGAGAGAGARIPGSGAGVDPKQTGSTTQFIHCIIETSFLFITL